MERCSIVWNLHRGAGERVGPAFATASASHSQAPPECVIRASALNHAYESANGWSTALRGFNLDIRGNEFLCVLGRSRCGKSSVPRMLAGLMFPLERTLLGNRRPVKGPIVQEDPMQCRQSRDGP